MKKVAFTAAIAALLYASAAQAATLISTASGSIGATGTWSVIDTTGSNAFLNSETANTALTTSAVASSTFTPAAETITSIGVKLAVLAAVPSGTMTIKLANSTSPGSRECTQTVNVSDLPSTNAPPAAATADGGWIILTCSAAPNGTDAYTINASTSVAAQVNLFSSATTNWSRLLVTSGTQSGGPAAGDKFYAIGQLTGAGTHNAYTVTIDSTSVVNYGNVANTLVDPSIAVGQWGTLAFSTTASTAFVAQFAGPMVVYNGGIFTVGTSASRIPATSTATLTLNSTSEGDTGIVVRNGATLNAFGSSGGRSVVKTTLSAAATTGNTTISTVASTGWLSGDKIAMASTDVFNGVALKDEVLTLSGNASGGSIPVSAVVNPSHIASAVNYTSSQTGKTYSMTLAADVVLLTRNAKIQGGSSSNNGYIYMQAAAIFAGDWIEFNQMSGTYATAQKRGLELDVGPAGSFSLTNFSLHDSHNSALIIGAANSNFGGTQSNYLTFQHGAVYNVANFSNGTQYGVGVNPANLSNSTNAFWKMDDVAVIHSGGAQFQQTGFIVNSPSGQFTNITIANSSNGGTGALQVGANYNTSTSLGGNINSWGPITLYGNAGHSMVMNGGSSSYGLSGTISGLYQWHEQGRFYAPGYSGDLVIDPFYQLTVAFGIYQPSLGGGRLTVRNGFQAWDVTMSSAFPLTQDAKSNEVYFDNMDLCPQGSAGTFGVALVNCNSGSTVNGLVSLVHDISPSGGGSSAVESKVFLRNTALSNNLGVNYPINRGEEAWYGPGAFVVQDCNACTPVKHAAWVAGGFLSYDTAVAHSSGYSLRMTPALPTFQGYITPNASAGTGTLTVTTSWPANSNIGDALFSNAAGFVPGTNIIAGTTSPLTVNVPQTVGSSGAPATFQTYYAKTGLLPRMVSAPLGYGTRVAVASGQSANVCVWLRPSINTDAASPWGTSAVTYTGDPPRMLVHANPYMGVQSRTVLGTSSLTAGVWSQFCASTPVAAADGEFELIVDADQTPTSNPGGSINVAEWSCTNCSGANNSQFFWNGTPAVALAPASIVAAGVGAFVH